MKKCLLITIFFLLANLNHTAFGQSRSSNATRIQCPDGIETYYSTPVYFDISPPLRDMNFSETRKDKKEKDKHEVPNFVSNMEGTVPANFRADPVWQKQGANTNRPASYGPIVNIEGIGNLDGVMPPDANGDVGTDRYIQVINSYFAVYPKTGSPTPIMGPAHLHTIWAGIGSPWEGRDDGDPIVLYDQAAGRWMISQFSLPSSSSNGVLIAISTTSDPTGTWYRYVYNFNSIMPDYPKFGVWPDGYYMSVNQFTGATGPAACVWQRSKMLNGDPTAGFIYKNCSSANGIMIPSDWDGSMTPPAGESNYFSFISGANLKIWSFHTDWTTPANSTISETSSLTPATFSSYFCSASRGRCIPQPGTSLKLESLSDRLMVRLQYRNFGLYQSMVTCHTVNVDGAGTAGMRWYELRNSGSGWSIYQQGTYAPDASCRWMGSVAMNAQGDIALGYSVSDAASVYPSIRYTGRHASDPLGMMTITEQTVVSGTASQTNSSYGRWGDYSGMSVDPSDDITFWYTNEYILTWNSSWPWQTRIASFRFANNPSVTTTAATALTANSATLNGLVNPNGISTTYHFEWGTTSSYGNNTPTLSAGSGSGNINVNAGITGLSGVTMYYYRLVGVNSDGTSYGNQMTFSTQGNLPTITTTSATSISQTTATTGGNITSDGGVTITARGVCWSTSPSPSLANSHSSDGSGVGNFITNLTGLTSNTLFYIRAYATNNVGTAYGNELTFTTLINPLLPLLTTSALSNVTQTTATSGGNITADGGSTVSFRGVCWGTSPGPTMSNSYSTNGNGTGTFVSNLTGLTSNTLYYLRAYAVNANGTSFGNEISFVTPVIITTTAVTGITQTTANSGGTVTAGGGAIISARGVCWSTSANPTIANSHTTDGTGSGTFVSNLTALTVNTFYYVRAYAINDYGITYGNELNFTATWTCGTSMTINHVAGTVAPVTKTVTYGTVTNIPGETSKCWITSNLGADHQATAVNDTSEASAGWYWQYNRTQGYKVTNNGTRTPNTTWITSINENLDWQTANDPCTIELGSGWRIPTNSEWTNLSSGWTDWNGPWNSGLKMHAAGELNNGAALCYRGSHGFYWSSTQLSATSGKALHFESTNSKMDAFGKVFGIPLRCVRNAPPPTVTTTSVSNINQTTATSGGNVTYDGGTSVTSRGVCWSTTANPTIIDSHTSDGSGTGTFISNLTGLIGNTDYYVRAYATNISATSYGDQKFFTTSPTIPILSTTFITLITTTTAVSGGTITSNGGDSIIARGVCWSITSNPTINGNHTTDGTGSGTFISNLIGLTEGTIYHVRSYATNSIGTSYGNEIMFTTFSLPSITGPMMVCVPSSVSIYSTESGMTGYTWAISAGGTITAGAGTNTITVNWNTAGTQSISVTYTYPNGYSPATPTLMNVTVNSMPAAIAGEDRSICNGSETQLGATPVAGSTYRWTSVPIGFTSVVANPTVNPALTTTFILTETVTATGCNQTNSVIVTVYPKSIGGSIAGSTFVCTGTNSTELTLSGYTGSITKWQKSTDNWVTPVDISNTGSTYVATNLLTTTKYRVLITSGTCSSVYSFDATISVDPVSVGGIIAGSTNVCTGTNSTILTLSGYNGSIIKWQKSTDSWVTSVDISNTIATYTATNLTATTKYRAVIQSGVCSSINSSDATVIVNSLPEPTISGPAIACNNSTANIYATQSGMTNYKWTVSAGGAITSGGTSADNTVTIAWNTAGAQTVSVNYTNLNGCTAASFSVKNIIINPLPVPTIAGPGTVLETSTENIYTTETGMSGYAWTVSGGGTITAGVGTNAVTVTWNTPGVQSLSVNYFNFLGCAAASPAVKLVTVNPLLVPTVSTASMSNITQTTATSGGTVISDGGTFVTARGVCWSVNANPTIIDTHTTDGNGSGTFISNLTDLTGSSIYHVRAYATNIVGTSYGNEISFPTTSLIHVTSPDGGETWLSGTSHEITWTSNDVSKVKIEYSIDNGTTWNAIINDTPAIPGIYAWTVTNPNPNVLYVQCQVKVTSTNNPNAFDVSNSTFTILNSLKYAPLTYTDTIEAINYTPITVPVKVDKFRRITGLSLRIDYNPAVLTYTGFANPNAALGDLYVNTSPISSSLSKVYISWSDPYPVTLADGSKIVDIQFTHNSGATTLVWNNEESGGQDCEYADSVGNSLIDLPTAMFYRNGEVHSAPGWHLSGFFNYNNSASTILDNVNVLLYRNTTRIDSVTTNSSGNYQFNQVPSGTYTIKATTNKLWSGVNATDAVKIQRHFAGLEMLTEPVRLLAGDVNNSNSINATDAIKVKRRFSGLDNSFDRGNWTFAKPSGGDTVIVNNVNLTQNFYGLCVGDVNGSNIPSSVKWLSQRVEIANEGTIQVKPGQTFELQVKAKNDMNVSAISLVIPYPEDLLEIEDVQINQGVPVFNILPGQIRIAWSELQPMNLKAGETLLTLKLRAKEAFTGSQSIELIPNFESELADDLGEVIQLAELTSLTIKPLNPNGINDYGELMSSCKVYPNPAKDYITIELQLNSTADCGIKLLDIVGREVKVIPVQKFEKGNSKVIIQTKELVEGMYTVKITLISSGVQKHYLKKIVVSR